MSFTTLKAPKLRISLLKALLCLADISKVTRITFKADIQRITETRIVRRGFEIPASRVPTINLISANESVLLGAAGGDGSVVVGNGRGRLLDLVVKVVCVLLQVSNLGRQRAGDEAGVVLQVGRWLRLEVHLDRLHVASVT
jgi:hypothetical protein